MSTFKTLSEANVTQLWNTIKSTFASKSDIGSGIPYLTCDTAADTAAKTTTLVDGSFAAADLKTGAKALVKFTYSNSVANPTLSINGTTAKSIKRYGTTAPSTSAASSWNAGSIVLFVYDGDYWQMEAWNNTTYTSMTESEIEAGTGTTARIITPARLKAAVQTWETGEANVIESVKVNGAALTPSSKAVDVSVPTKVSDLTNDSGFISSADIPEGSAASTTTPAMDGTASTGSETAFARGDHVHPTDTSRLSTSGDGSNVTAAFSAASSRSNIATGEKLSVLFGKIAKYLADLGSLAFKSEVAKTDLASGVQTSLGLADSALQSFTETDPTVPSWAKASSKPFYTASEVGAVPTSRTVNSKALSSNITLTASDVGALPDSTTIPYASSTTPKMDGTAAVGSESTFAKGDHVHPTDTSRQAKITANGLLKGDGNGGVTAAIAGTDYLATHQDISGKLDKSGGIMTGKLTLDGAPTSNLHAATKKYVDDNIPDVSGKLDKSGGTMTGALTLSGAPTADLHAATKKYVDDNAGGGATITYGTTALTDGVSPLAAGTLYVQYSTS